MHMLKGGEPMATQTRHTALIVDDSEISREILKNIFSAHYAIEEARDGEEDRGQEERYQEETCSGDRGQTSTAAFCNPG